MYTDLSGGVVKKDVALQRGGEVTVSPQEALACIQLDTSVELAILLGTSRIGAREFCKDSTWTQRHCKERNLERRLESQVDVILIFLHLNNQ